MVASEGPSHHWPHGATPWASAPRGQPCDVHACVTASQAEVFFFSTEDLGRVKIGLSSCVPFSARPVEATGGGPRWQHAFGEALAQAEAYELRASVGLTGAKRKHTEVVCVEADSDCATDDGVVAVEATVAAGSGEDCGECATCLDKPNFGGPGPKRRACLVKKTPPSGATTTTHAVAHAAATTAAAQPVHKQLRRCIRRHL